MGDLPVSEAFVGPIISPRQRDQCVLVWIKLRRKALNCFVAAWVGNRCRPTILRGVNESMDVCRNETFGPVTSLYTFDTIGEAMEKRTIPSTA